MMQSMWKQRGAVLILSAFLLPLTLAICGFAVDGANAYYHKSKLQNSVDAAAIAGGYRYGDRESQADTEDAVLEYMDKNQGEEAYELDSIRYKRGKQQGTTRITVTASEEVPVFFIGPILRYLSSGADHSADTWTIRAEATAEVVRVASDVPQIFEYTMIGGFDGKPVRRRPNEWKDVMGGVNDIKNSLVFHTADVKITGKVHANGSVYLDDTFVGNDASRRDYFISADQFSTAATRDADLWSNYRDNYNEHYVGGRDSVWDNQGHQTYYDTKDSTVNDTAHVNPGHEHDDKIITGPGSRDFTWRYYYRMGMSAGKDVTAEESAASQIDISLRDDNPMTSALCKTIRQYKDMSLQDLENAHVYIDTDGNYQREKTFADRSYQLDPSHTTTIYPGITCGSFKVTDAESWKVWDKVYKVVIVDGDLQVNIPAGQKPDDENDHLLFVSLHGNISVQSSSPIQGFFYAPQGTVLIDGSKAAAITGSIVAKSIMLTTGGQRIHATHSTFSGGSSSQAGGKGNQSLTVHLVSDEDDEE